MHIKENDPEWNEYDIYLDNVKITNAFEASDTRVWVHSDNYSGYATLTGKVEFRKKAVSDIHPLYKGILSTEREFEYSWRDPNRKITADDIVCDQITARDIKSIGFYGDKIIPRENIDPGFINIDEHAIKKIEDRYNAAEQYPQNKETIVDVVVDMTELRAALDNVKLELAPAPKAVKVLGMMINGTYKFNASVHLQVGDTLEISYHVDEGGITITEVGIITE